MAQNIWDEAFDDTLQIQGINRYLAHDPTCVNRVGGKHSLTPLAGACYRGNLQVVEYLLEKGADPNIPCAHDRTALFYVLTQSPPNLLAIVDALLDADANPNEVYSDDDTVNALTLAIEESRNKGAVQALVNAGANPTPENKRQASARKMEECLQPKVVPEPKAPKEFKTRILSFINKTGLDKFFTDKDKKALLKGVAEKASALSNDPTTDLGKPENIKRLVVVSLYQLVIYCDDSGSMEGDRYRIQRELVRRITTVAMKLLPEDAVVNLRFINSSFRGNVTVAGADAAMASVSPDGGTALGTSLVQKILRPLVYDMISSNNYKFERPILICAITDGSPNRDDYPIKQAIVDCKRALVNKAYDPTSVMFCVSQIGNDSSARSFLDELRSEREIEDVLYCTTDQLDAKLMELKKNERELDVWLLRLLAKPLMRYD